MVQMMNNNKVIQIQKQMQRLWRAKADSLKKQQPQQKDQVNLLLPNQIGCRIIEMEMEVMETENLTKDNILDLIHQYSKAVEFYEERGCTKYLIYQRKMQSFLSKPAITEIMNGKTGTMLIKKQKNDQELKKVQTQSQVVAKKLLQDSKQSGQKQQDIIRKQLQNQQKSLEERIQRKRAISNRSVKDKSHSGSFTVPQKTNDDEKHDNVIISEFMESCNIGTSSNAKKNLKVFM